MRIHRGLLFIASTLAATLMATADALSAEPKTGGTSSTALSPEALGAKALLEDLLVRRYSQELSTFVTKDNFSLGADIDLVEVPPKLSPLKITETGPRSESEPISDLMLGTLDPEQLIKAYSSPIEERPMMAKLLDNFKIKTVSVSVGLKDELGPTVKSDIDAWLKKRLKSEFGKAGKGVVSTIKVPLKKVDIPVEKTPEQYLEQYQGLAGQLVIAVAILIGVMLYQLMAKPAAGSAEASGGGASVGDESDMAALQRMAAEVEADNKKSGAASAEVTEAERVRAIADIEQIKIRLVELVPKLSGYLEEIVRNWCHMGDSGKLRIACFAEVAGKEIGKLPIPVDSLADIQKVFARMPEIAPRERRDALQRAYWDLLSALNLGSDSLSQPFGYLDGLNVQMVNRVLMDQNPKLRTVVSLYMTDDLRAKYMRSLPSDKKKELLEMAAGLSEIQADELESYNRGLMSKLSPTRGQEIVPLEMSLTKLVNALSPMEEVTLLAEMKGRVIEEYKRTVPSLAFLHQWPDMQLKFLLMGITPDELISFLRVRTDLKDRMIEHASMMVREIAGEELNAADKSTPAEKEEGIKFFTQRLRDMVGQGDLNLEEIFGPLEENVIPIVAEDGAASGDSKVA